ncbi:MAG: hypothetical protein GY865_11065, partial [candidate division Zixibacteria bacterium]|nr:hypothetical protein [candidate division Zixibacteria bacterium]
RFIPKNNIEETSELAKDKSTPEKIVFDKAEQAESLENMQRRFETLGDEINTVKERQKQTDEKTKLDELKLQKEWLEKRREFLAEIIKKRENKEKDE